MRVLGAPSWDDEEDCGSWDRGTFKEEEEQSRRSMIGWSWGRVWEARKGSFSIWENGVLKKREKNKKSFLLYRSVVTVCVVGVNLIGGEVNAWVSNK